MLDRGRAGGRRGRRCSGHGVGRSGSWRPFRTCHSRGDTHARERGAGRSASRDPARSRPVARGGRVGPRWPSHPTGNPSCSVQSVESQQQLYVRPLTRARGDARLAAPRAATVRSFRRRAVARILGWRRPSNWQTSLEGGVSAGRSHGKESGDAPPNFIVFGASWGSDDTIVFAQRVGGLWRVSAAGGNAEPLTTLDATQGEFSHRLPFVLPGSQAVLFTVTYAQFPQWNATDIAVQSLATGERKILIKGGADARYVPTGHLVYMRVGTLMAVPFNLETAGSDGRSGRRDRRRHAGNDTLPISARFGRRAVQRV